MARILIVGGGCRGRRLASIVVGEGRGNAVRITTRTEAGRAAIEEAGAECWIGTPARLATLRGALENVTVVCWLLGAVEGSEEEIRALHSTRLEFFLGQAIDTTMRGFVYEAGAAKADPACGQPSGASGGAPGSTDVVAGGESIVRAVAARNAIPVAFLRTDPSDSDAWLIEAQTILGTLLGDREAP